MTAARLVSRRAQLSSLIPGIWPWAACALCALPAVHDAFVPAHAGAAQSYAIVEWPLVGVGVVVALVSIVRRLSALDLARRGVVVDGVVEAREPRDAEGDSKVVVVHGASQVRTVIDMPHIERVPLLVDPANPARAIAVADMRFDITDDAVTLKDDGVPIWLTLALYAWPVIATVMSVVGERLR